MFKVNRDSGPLMGWLAGFQARCLCRNEKRASSDALFSY